ncbi:MAG: class II fructose-bisphosphate aldolase [Actinobacteria bacterium]|nr:class II fructose-bisphosphate aldolase [Actinomycetota bacterium]
MTQLNPLKIITGELKNAAAVGAFNVILLEHAEAIVAGAERVKLPVVLQISQNCVDYHGALKPIALASKAIAQASLVNVSLHLDHAESELLIQEALDLGFDSVMFDGSKLEYSSNVQASARMAELCRQYGATIEVELGEVGGKDGVHAPGVRTNPTEAQAFVEATGVDLLAVAVGSSHAMTTRDATLDFELISHIAKTVSVPLVLHGSSGVNDEDLQRAVKAGMRKINIATHLNHLFTDEIRKILNSDSKIVDPRKYVRSARNKVADECGRLLQLLALS